MNIDPVITRPSRLDNVIYAAGFVDGEGCINIAGRLGGLQLTVSQRVREPLDLLVVLFGGRVAEYTRDRGYYWVINGTRAASALREMLPFLIVKRRQAELGIQWKSIVLKAYIPHATREERWRRRDAIAAEIQRQKRPWLEAV